MSHERFILYRERLFLPPEKVDELRHHLIECAEWSVKKAAFDDVGVKFLDGMRMTLQVVPAHDQPYRAVANLFSPKGVELGCTEPSDRVLGVFYIRGYEMRVLAIPETATVRGRFLEERSILCAVEDQEWALAQCDTAEKDGWDIVR